MRAEEWFIVLHDFLPRFFWRFLLLGSGGSSTNTRTQPFPGVEPLFFSEIIPTLFIWDIPQKPAESMCVFLVGDRGYDLFLGEHLDIYIYIFRSCGSYEQQLRVPRPKLKQPSCTSVLPLNWCSNAKAMWVKRSTLPFHSSSSTTWGSGHLEKSADQWLGLSWDV